MPIRDELLEQYKVYLRKNRDTPNSSKPNRIILNQEAYDEMLKTSKMRNMPNPVMTWDDFQIVCESNQEERIKFEKRRFHND